MLCDDKEMIPVTHDEELPEIIRVMMEPTMRAMSDMVQHVAEALERLAVQQKIQSERMEALEKQIRLNTPVTPTQARMLNGAIRSRASELLAKREDTESAFYPQQDRKCINRISGIIRKALLTHYGIACVNEIPRCEYHIALDFINGWNGLMEVRDTVREYALRKESEHENS